MAGAAAHRDGAVALERVCKYRYCDLPLDGRRPQCEYCTPAHRAAESRERRAEAAGAPLPRRKPHRNRTSALRRANREGVGTRLYVSGPEVELVRSALRRLDLPRTPGGDRLKRKLDLAAERVARKEKEN